MSEAALGLRRSLAVDGNVGSYLANLSLDVQKQSLRKSKISSECNLHNHGAIPQTEVLLMRFAC